MPQDGPVRATGGDGIDRRSQRCGEDHRRRVRELEDGSIPGGGAQVREFMESRCDLCARRVSAIEGGLRLSAKEGAVE